MSMALITTRTYLYTDDEQIWRPCGFGEYRAGLLSGIAAMLYPGYEVYRFVMMFMNTAEKS